MRMLFTIMLAVSPVYSGDTKAVPQDSPVPMEMESTTFEDDVDSASAKILRWITESRERRQVRRIREALVNRDTKSAQEALDTLVRDFPEIKEQEPQAIRFHQGNINFWKRDLDGAYKEYDEAIKALEQEYPKGFPPGNYLDNNKSFMADLYFGRGATQLHRRKYPEAIADINKAMLTYQPRAYMMVNKCRAFLRLKKYKEAADAYNAAYKINSEKALEAEDKADICTLLEKNSFRPLPCVSKE